VTDEPRADAPGGRPQSAALWAGRFATPPAPEARALGRSLHYDVRLAAHDVRAGIAHAGALEAAGLLTAEDASRLTEALRAVGAAIADGTFVFDDVDEDVHSAIERGVTDLVGDLGARLHAGRSRNDLVVTDVRLWLLEGGRRIDGLVTMLIRTLIERARDHADTIVPGTTHARLAQPVTLGHHLLAHAWALTRDLERLGEWSERTAVSPLGAGALGTSTLGLEPAATAERLGMRGAFENSIDAVSDRDFALEFLGHATILAMHLSRLAADLARFTEESLGWAELDEAYATGSSMMPQKRNPDTAELVRGKAARVAAGHARLAALLQGLPLGYHRDLQEDKEPLFDAADTLELVLPALIGAMATVRFDLEAMRRAAEADGLYATDLAEALVAAGLPFREAHRRTGALLKDLVVAKRSLRDLTSDEWAAFGVPEGAALLDPDHAVRARSMPGGPSPESVRAQIAALDRLLGERRDRR
jgi:argininosuccinate lyase